MPKESYDDEAKGRWRHQWRKFTKHISKSPRDTKVVFLPGRQALELFEVYDQRGIPRSNIIGIERDKDIYDHLKSQRLGIELFHGTDTEFFEHADGKFDIVNLDYDGTYNASVQRSLELMAGRQLLKSPSVLGVLICENIVQISVRHLYQPILFTNYLSQLRLSEGEEDFAKSANTLFDLATIGEDQILKEAERFGYKRGELRDKMITEMIMSTLYGGREGVEPHPLLNKVSEPDKTKDKMDGIWRRVDIQ